MAPPEHVPAADGRPGHPRKGGDGARICAAVVPLAPAAVIIAVASLELATGADAVVLALVVIAPLFSSSLLGPGPTAAYAVAALLVGAGLGLYADQYVPDRLSDQLVRLVTISAAGALAVAASRNRVRREERLAQVRRVAAVAQEAILPPVPERLGPLLLAASYDSAEEEAAVDGDLYAAVSTPFGQRLLLADVRGHGLDAVRLASIVLGAFRERAHERPLLDDLTVDLDGSVTRAADLEDFVTGVLLEVSDGHLLISNAGHTDPLLLRAGTTVPLAPTHPSLPLGLGARTSALDLALEPGDRLLLYTDGAAEARRPADGAFFPLTQVAARNLRTGTLPQGLTRLRAALTEWTGGALTDDVTLLAIEYAPAEPPGA